MELHQLRYFVAVAETGSFSKAARRCAVAQPSLSQQVRKLEDSLGRRLFDRLPGGAELTEAGHALLPRARRILSEVREAGENLGADIDAGAGPIAIGAIPTMAPYLMPEVVRRFVRERPQAVLTVREDLTERLIESLLEGELDLAIASAPIEDESLEVETIAQERLLVAMAKDAPKAGADRLTLRDLRDEPAVVLHEMHCLGRQIEGFCAARGLRQRIVCRGTQLHTALDLVSLGLGVTIVPEMCAAADRSKLRVYRELRGGPTREITLVWRKGRSRSALAQRMAEIARSVVRERAP